MAVYFAGTVLPPRENLDGFDAQDDTFFFTKNEKENLDLTDVPIRLEHSDNLQVGKILRNFTVDDSTYVVGKIDGKGLKTAFAKNALAGDGPFYGSLSLQHSHTIYTDGTTKKKPIEVSLCTNPRRKGSSITFVSKPQETKKKKYISTETLCNNIMSADTKETVHAASAKETTEPVAEKESSPMEEDKPASATMAPEQYMRIIIEQEQALDKLRTDNASVAEELEKIHSANEAKAKEEHARELQKAQLITETLTKEWQSELPATLLTDDVLASLKLVAEKMPKHATAIYELSHMASEQHKKLSDEFSAFKKDLTRARSEGEFRAVMERRRDVRAVKATPAAPDVKHEASARAAPVQEMSDVDKFRELATKYRPGNVISTMSKCVERRARKRRKPFSD
jgi:hypothetical protein